MTKELSSPPPNVVEWVIQYGSQSVRVQAQTAFLAYEAAYPQLLEREPGVRPNFPEVQIYLATEESKATESHTNDD